MAPGKVTKIYCIPFSASSWRPSWAFLKLWSQSSCFGWTWWLMDCRLRPLVLILLTLTSWINCPGTLENLSLVGGCSSATLQLEVRTFFMPILDAFQMSGFQILECSSQYGCAWELWIMEVAYIREGNLICTNNSGQVTDSSTHLLPAPREYAWINRLAPV